MSERKKKRAGGREGKVDEMKDNLQSILYLVIALLAVSVSVWWMVIQWGECRNAGLSSLYCLQHIF